MKKGFMLLLLVGAGFAYFIYYFVTDVSGEDPLYKLSPELRKEKELANYYKKDPVTGDWVMRVGGLSEEKAKKLWREGPILQEVLDNFPKFDLMKEIVRNQVSQSPFRQKLLRHLDNIEDRYLSGEIDAQRARELIEEF